MKNFYLTSIIALFIFIVSDGIMAQSKGTKPNQFELAKQYSKLLKIPGGDKFKSASAVNQLLDSTILELYDSTAGQFVFQSKTISAYDTKGDTSTDILYYWIDSTWIASLKSVYTYDDQGNMTSDINYYLDENSNWNWYDIRKYTYDDKGNVILDITYTNEINLQILSGTKHEYTYDNNGNMTLDVRYIWNVTDSLWVNDGKSYYTYDVNGNMVTEIYYYWGDLDDWNITPPEWILFYKGEFTYNTNGNKKSGTDYYWNDSTKKWYVDKKYEYTNDANGNITSLSAYTVDAADQYENYFKYENTYDVNGNIISQIYYLWYESIDKWAANNKVNYYYSEQSSTVTPLIPGREIKVYPNPSSDYVLFDLTYISDAATVELYDIQGKKVLEQKLSDNKQISVRNLSEGMYLFILNDRGTIYKGKIFVE